MKWDLPAHISGLQDKMIGLSIKVTLETTKICSERLFSEFSPGANSPLILLRSKYIYTGMRVVVKVIEHSFGENHKIFQMPTIFFSKYVVHATGHALQHKKNIQQCFFS